ncbi:MAG: LlaJI family restriction endonuclease [Treponema sp.]|nr:LlaJI family restriction endonuclease [Treponema sp.]
MQIFLLEDYYRNGIYENKETVIETNGEGEIDWDKTINETTAIIKNQKPYYVELQTINTRSNDFDYFKLLHESILCECSRTLRDTGILGYLGMIPCELTGMELSSFGDVNYIKYRLQQEIRIQFVTRKRNQLISLITDITESNSRFNSNTIKLYGTYHFEHIWEVLCKAVFDDLYNNKNRIGITGLEASPSINELINAGYIKNDISPDSVDISLNLKDLIERVKWNMNSKNSIVTCTPDGNLTPDLICIDEKDIFYILDAKYYLVKVSEKKKKIENQPGIQDVLKQFAYEKAYHDFLKDFKFYRTLNAFIMPSLYSKCDEQREAISTVKGNITFSLMQTSSYDMLGAIQVLEIRPEFLYENYLKSKSCLYELTKFVSTKGILHSINRNITADGTDAGYTMVGFLRSSYVEQIKDGNDFLFYFYVKKDFRELQIHPELLHCTKFIGYQENNTEKRVVKGLVIPEIKRIDEVALRNQLKEMGFDKKPTDIEEYYCIRIEKAKIESYTDDQFIKLQKSLKEAPGNFLLDDFSPKVI